MRSPRGQGVWMQKSEGSAGGQNANLGAKRLIKVNNLII